jgi:hypothetical protein
MDARRQYQVFVISAGRASLGLGTIIAAVLVACGPIDQNNPLEVRSKDPEAEDLPRIERFEVAPSKVGRGGRPTLYWWVENGSNLLIETDAGLPILHCASSPTADPAVASCYEASPLNAIDGRWRAEPVDTPTTFTLRVDNAVGFVEQSASVEVDSDLPVPMEIRRFKVSPLGFNRASAVEISWDAIHTSTLSLTTNATVTRLANSGTITVSLSETTRFELVAENGATVVREMRSVGRTVAESEPNDDVANAEELITGAATGELSTTDVDVFRIVVPDGGDVFAECDAYSVLALIAPDGTTVLGRSRMNAGTTTRIDPTLYSFARNLDGGTYYLRLAQAPGGVLSVPYTLVVTVGRLPPQ